MTLICFLSHFSSDPQSLRQLDIEYYAQGSDRFSGRTYPCKRSAWSQTCRKDKEKRFYNVRCLVWLASKYKRNPDTILEIFRLLSIRGVKNPCRAYRFYRTWGYGNRSLKITL